MSTWCVFKHHIHTDFIACLHRRFNFITTVYKYIELSVDTIYTFTIAREISEVYQGKQHAGLLY